MHLEPLPHIMVRLTTHSLEGREVGVHLEPIPYIMHVVPRALNAIIHISRLTNHIC